MDSLGGSTVLIIILFVNVFLLGCAVAVALMHWRRHLAPRATSQASSSLPDRVQEKILVQAQDAFEKVLHESATTFGNDLQTTTTLLNQQLGALTNDLLKKEIARYKQTLVQLQDDATKKYGETGNEISIHAAELEHRLNERLKKMDEILASHQQLLEQKLVTRSGQLAQEFQNIQAEQNRRQAEFDAELAEKEARLRSELAQRETSLSSRQSELEQSLVHRQQLFIAKQTELEQQLEAEMAKQRAAYQAAIDTKLSDAVVSFLSDTLGRNVDLGAQTPYLLQQLEAHKEQLKQELEP